MDLRTFKYWARSGSWDFARNFSQTSPQDELAQLQWRGHPLFYRPGTSDSEILYRILMKPEKKREYQAPLLSNPKIILDIGANIGAASLWLTERFPTAQIYSFEPMPQNYALLERNTAAYPNIHTMPLALGAEEGIQELFASDDIRNMGGCSFFEAGSNPQKRIRVSVCRPEKFLEENGIHEIDLIKIDTEGAEYDILTSFPDSVLEKTQWILGEIHGNKDFELMAFLSRYFDISIQKKLHTRLGNFTARRKTH